jgi:hypothetical protein
VVRWLATVAALGRRLASVALAFGFRRRRFGVSHHAATIACDSRGVGTQPLFANQRETNLASTRALVEEVLVELGHAPTDTRLTDASSSLHVWKIARGSATAHIALLDRPAFTHIRVSAIVMTLDSRVDRAALYAHLLDANASLCGAAFALDGDRVLLVAERSTLDLDRSEVRDVIHNVLAHADDHDEALVARFGGRLGG